MQEEILSKSSIILKLNAFSIIYATHCQNFDFKSRRNHRKKLPMSASPMNQYRRWKPKISKRGEKIIRALKKG